MRTHVNLSVDAMIPSIYTGVLLTMGGASKVLALSKEQDIDSNVTSSYQRCTLEEKSTSPLECLNKVLKSGSRIRVAPNMFLLQSMRIQDTQADARMNENICCEL